MSQFFILFDFIKKTIDLQMGIYNSLQPVEGVYNYVSKVSQTSRILFQVVQNVI